MGKCRRNDRRSSAQSTRLTREWTRTPGLTLRFQTHSRSVRFLFQKASRMSPTLLQMWRLLRLISSLPISFHTISNLHLSCLTTSFILSNNFDTVSSFVLANWAEKKSSVSVKFMDSSKLPFHLRKINTNKILAKCDIKKKKKKKKKKK